MKGIQGNILPIFIFFLLKIWRNKTSRAMSIYRRNHNAKRLIFRL